MTQSTWSHPEGQLWRQTRAEIHKMGEMNQPVFALSHQYNYHCMEELTRELGTLHGKVTTCKPLSPLHL